MSQRVLVVAESLTVRMNLKEAFEQTGFVVTLSDSVGAARAAIASEQPDLIVIDPNVPDAAEISGSPIPVIRLDADVSEIVARAQGSLGRKIAATVLVIDDSATFREEMREALTRGGYRVLLAETGEQGLGVAAASRPDAAVVDGMMPGIDGLTVVRRMRLDPGLRRIPCILLTASEEQHLEVQSLEAGADAYVRKGERTDVILARIAALLRSVTFPAAREQESSMFGPRRLLAVDDSPTHLHQLSEQLQHEGYQVLTAASGEEALEIIRKESVDCILMDLMMPGLSGHEACRRIKAHPEWRDIPLLVLTAHDEREAMLEAFQAGADDFITKSGDFAVLKGRLRAQIRRKHYEDENRRIREELLRKEHEAQEALSVRQSEALLRMVIETLPVGVWVLDKQGQILMANAAGKEIFGGIKYVGMDRFGEYKAWWPETGERVKSEEWAAARALVKKEIVIDDVVEIESFDGVRKTILNSAFPVNDADNTLIGAIAVNQDITQRRQAELALQEKNLELERARAQAERESQFKSKFLASMSHELRTPLNAIIGFSELLEQELFGPLNPRQKDYVSNVLTSGRHLLDLINDVLDISKIEAGRMQLTREWISLGGVVEAVRGVIAPLAGAKAISMDFDVQGDLPEIFVDPVRLKQILYNLLSNAIKFTPAHGSAGLRASQVDKDLRIDVTDTGIGIRAEDMPRLFREFERIESQTGEQLEGTGLGLVLTRKLVELHGGTISVQSEAGRGSTFTVILPAPRGQPSTESFHPDDARPDDSLALVVEDDPKAAELIAGQLRAVGLSVAFAAGGQEAIRLAAELQPAVITLDILLPDMSGLALLGHLKAAERTASIPVLVISVVDERTRGFILGASDYLVKPVSREVLLNSLASAGAPVQRVAGLKVLLVGDGNGDIGSVEQQLRVAGCQVRRGGFGMMGEPDEDFLPDIVVVDLCGKNDCIAAVEGLVEEADQSSIPILGIVDPGFVPPRDLKKAFEKLAHDDALRPERLVRAVRRTLTRSRAEG